MNKIKDIIMSGTEPSVKENGWLVPNKDGKLELKFFGPNGWETVSSSSGGSDSDNSSIIVLPTIGAPEEIGDTTAWTRDIVEKAAAIFGEYSEAEDDFGPVVLTTYANQMILYVIQCRRYDDGSIQAVLSGQCPFFYPLSEERIDLMELGYYIVATLEPTEDIMKVRYIGLYTAAIQPALTTDESLSYESRHLDDPTAKDILSIADGGVTLAKLAPDVPIYQPPKITFSNTPKKGDVISNWTRDVWDRVNNIELQTIKVDNATYWVGQKSTDKLNAICSYSAIQNGTLMVVYIEIGLAWDTATSQTKVTDYTQLTNTAIQTPTLPTIKTLPVEEEVITEWTAADFNACRNGFENTPKTYHQVFIEGKLYTPIWVSDNEEQDDDIILGSMETTTDSLINTTLVRIRLENNSVLLIEKTSHTGAGCVTRVIDVADTQLVGFSDEPSIFEDTFGVSPDLLYYTEGTLTVRGYWFNTSQMVSLTAVSCYADDERNWKTVFTDGTNLVTVNYDSMGNSVDITSTPVLTEGRAPTMTQFNALSAQIGDIDTVLTSIIGE